MNSTTTGFDRDALARWYAKRHLDLDSGVVEIYYLPTDAPDREVRLLEVNRMIPEQSDAALEPIDFGVDTGGVEGHTLVILDVTPRQWGDIENGRLALPPSWRLDGSIRFKR
jgi:hypothetical protein